MKKITTETMETIAQKFRWEIGASSSGAIPIKSVLHKLNIIALFRPLSSKFYGMSLQSKNGLSFMLINSENSIGRQHFSIAHELYHLFIAQEMTPHFDNACQEKSVAEQNADSFAASFLMPKMGVLSFLSQEEIKTKKINLATIIKIEQYFSVSREAILIRLRSTNLISQHAYQELSQHKATESAHLYGYDTALYKKGNHHLFIGDYGEKALQLFDKEIISEGHYNELINLIRDEKDCLGC